MKTKLKPKEKLFVASCLLPAVILTIVFFLIPLVRGLALSFTDATATSINGKFILFDNYMYLFKDKDFKKALVNTLKLLVIVPIIVNFLALILAFLVTQSKLKEKGFYRFVLFFPSIISATAIGALWSNIFSPTMGIFRKFGELFGIDAWTKMAVLGDAKLVLIAIAIIMVWQSAGYDMVIYIAAIDGIDQSIYEAATLDGCGTMKKLFYITIPILKNMISSIFVLSFSGVFGMSYIIVMVMTEGGPSGASNVLLYYMYKQAFQQSNFGYAMSIAVFTMFMAFVLSVVSRKIIAKENA